jgi:hypothetical protein
MPTDTLPDQQQDFCDALKAARKRRGISIADIAASTKVCPTHFVALERNDLSLWPKGLFRRAFFRGYVSMIGLPVAETLDEFIRLFPDGDRPAAGPAPATAGEEVRLTLDESWHGLKAPIGRRLAVAAIDAAAVTSLAAAVAWMGAMSFATVLAATAMIYFTVIAALLAESPAASCARWSLRMAARVKPAPAAAIDGGTADAPQANEQREWISDATRVRPRSEPPRLRVRFKLSS